MQLMPEYCGFLAATPLGNPDHFIVLARGRPSLRYVTFKEGVYVQGRSQRVPGK